MRTHDMSCPLDDRTTRPEGWRNRYVAGLLRFTRAGRRFVRRPAFWISAVVICAFCAANAVVAITIFRASHHEAVTWPGNSFAFWPERKWDSIEDRIRGLKLPARMESLSLGGVNYRQGSLPVHLIRVYSVRKETPDVKILLVSGIHGTETAGVEALLQFSELLSRNPSQYPGVSFDIVPVANPWGWVYGYRYDGDGEDVNRDFASRRTQEARFVQDLIRRDGPFDLVMDLHESKKTGYFIYQYPPDETGLGSDFAKLVRSMGKPLENSYSEWIFPARNGILKTPAPALYWIALGRSLSLEQFARMHGTAHSYTVETPLTDDFASRVSVHMKTIQTFIARLSEEQAGR